MLALAETFRGDGEIVANPIGALPRIAGRLARAAFEPRLLLPGRDAFFVDLDDDRSRAGTRTADVRRRLERPPPRRHGREPDRPLRQPEPRRHRPRPEQPKRQLLGFRGAPGNTMNHPTSYWVPRHSPRVFVEKVDVVCGVGYDRAAELGPDAARFHEIRRVVTDLAVLDFADAGPPHAAGQRASRRHRRSRSSRRPGSSSPFRTRRTARCPSRPSRTGTSSPCSRRSTRTARDTPRCATAREAGHEQRRHRPRHRPQPRRHHPRTHPRHHR